MSNNEYFIFVAGVAFAFLVWAVLPMSVFEENNPGVSTVLKIVGTVSGVAAVCWFLYRKSKQPKNKRPT